MARMTTIIVNITKINIITKFYYYQSNSDQIKEYMHVLRILVMSLSNVSLYMLTKVVAFVAYIVPISMLMLLTGEMICLHACLRLSCVLYICNLFLSLSLSLSLSLFLSLLSSA